MSDDKSILSTDPNGIVLSSEDENRYPGGSFDRSLKLDECSLIKLDDSQPIDALKFPENNSPNDPNVESSTPTKFEDSSGKSPLVDPYAGKEVYLNIEGGQEVFYHGTYVTRIPLHGESLLVGRRDVMAGHYPDIDLALYWKQDRCLSRKHLRIYRDMKGSYFVEDLCYNNATFINSLDHPLNRQRAELKPGDRILVSMSIVIDFCVF